MTASIVVFLRQESLAQERGFLKAWRMARKTGTGCGVGPLTGLRVLGSLIPGLP